MLRSGAVFVLMLLIHLSATNCKNEGNAGVAEKSKPEIIHTGMAAPDIIVLTIRAQWIEHGKQVPYEKQPGDSVFFRGYHRIILRDGSALGALVGSKANIICTSDRIYGDTLDTKTASETGTYNIVSGKKELQPRAVFRKSKPVDCTRFPAVETHALEHTIILKLPEPLIAGTDYVIHLPEGWIAETRVPLHYDPRSLRSEAIHVNQVGYRTDDPAKLAFLSFWMGDGGGLVYPEGVSFSLLDDKTGNEVYKSTVILKRKANDPLSRTFADIHEMDFSGYNTPGTYRISVEGVGCSFPFTISQDVWKDAFIKSMRGLYCQRSGIALGQPYTNFIRQRGFHPDDGVKVYVSEPRQEGEDPDLRKLNPELAALVASFTPQERFQKWIDDLTNRTLPDAWGGYMDAGDWDRRPDHVLMPLMMFDLEEMHSDMYKNWRFNIPESDDNLPDLVNEALWLVDFLRRMQQEDGSVYAAIESGSHPRRGEASWQESLPVFAYARTAGSAYNFAAVAARAAHWFKSNGMEDRVKEYMDPSVKAFKWAEANSRPNARSGAGDRCLAAAELYRLTGADQYHNIFLSTTRFKSRDVPFYTSAAGPNGDAQGEAGWTYMRTNHPGVINQVQQNIRYAMERDANIMVENTQTSDFNWAGGPQRQIRWGALSMPESQLLCRAHYVTGKDEYLRAIVLSTLSGAGANPVNMCYVTGVGTRWPQHPLSEDAYVTNQQLYEGVTIGGPIDPNIKNKHANSRRVEKMMYPDAFTWPPAESYFDVWIYVPMNEYTVHQTMLPTSFVWGYLAARK